MSTCASTGVRSASSACVLEAARPAAVCPPRGLEDGHVTASGDAEGPCECEVGLPECRRSTPWEDGIAAPGMAGELPAALELRVR